MDFSRCNLGERQELFLLKSSLISEEWRGGDGPFVLAKCGRIARFLAILIIALGVITDDFEWLVIFLLVHFEVLLGNIHFWFLNKAFKTFC